MKKYQYFSSENFPFLVVRFSVYFDKHVFVMQSFYTDTELTSSSSLYFFNAERQAKEQLVSLLKSLV